MDISNIPIAKNMISAGTIPGALRQNSGLTSGRDVTPGTDISGISTLKSIDLAARQGYREDYSVWDAADSLWKQETQTINLKDLEDPEKSKEFLENWRVQARWDLGIQGGGPTKEEVIANYIQGLRQNGLDGSVNWSGLSREFSGFKTTAPEELEDGLNYMASRYVAARDKLERNYSGDELDAGLAKLEEVYQAGKSGMIDGYTRLLRDNLGISGAAQEVKDSLSAILAEKEEAYRGALGKVQEAVSQSGPDGVWLKNHDAYIASQLRAAGAPEALISKGLVSDNMADLLRASRAQGHQTALDALDQVLAKRESRRLPGEPRGTYAPVDAAVFRGIYDAVMSAFRQNGGDAARAIQAGVSAGQRVTGQAAARNPNALRWGVSRESYWREFYKTPEERAPTVLGLQIQYLTQPKPRSSTYQKYVNSWQDFLASIGGGVDTRA